MLGRSFRTFQQSDMIRTGCSLFTIQTLFNKHGIDQKLRIIAGTKERKIIHNSTHLTSLSNLMGIIQGILVTPDDVNLLKGSPLLRRRYIDLQIAQSDPLYVHYLTRYEKAMFQRNRLLRQKQMQTIEVWEYEMAQAAAYIIRKRQSTIDALVSPCRQFYAYLTEEREQLAIIYRSSAPHCNHEIEIKEHILKQLQKNRGREMAIGYTLTGPHREDLWIGVGEKGSPPFCQRRPAAQLRHRSAYRRMETVKRDDGRDSPLYDR